MTKKMLFVPLAVAICVLGSGSSAFAGQVIFDFNSLASGTGASGGVGPTGSIQNYMQSLLTGGATVSVTAGAVTEKTYNGDGHVTGPGTGTTSLTLGTSDGAVQHLASTDTFVRNLSSATGWSFIFGGGFLIDSVQFDYQIFPDGTCPQLTSSGCGGSPIGGIYPNQPDFKFSTNLGQVFQYYALAPGSGGASSPYTKSPCTNGVGVSCLPTTEKAPQLIGTTTLLNVGGASTLTFLDWPAMIGIDNLVVNFRNPPVGPAAVPEPGTMILLGTGLAAAYARRKKRLA